MGKQKFMISNIRLVCWLPVDSGGCICKCQQLVLIFMLVFGISMDMVWMDRRESCVPGIQAVWFLKESVKVRKLFVQGIEACVAGFGFGENGDLSDEYFPIQ